MLSASHSFFSHKVHNIRFEKQICILTYLMVIELGPPMFYNPTEHKLHRMGNENSLSIGLELEFSWMEIYSHNHYIMFS